MSGIVERLFYLRYDGCGKDISAVDPLGTLLKVMRRTVPALGRIYVPLRLRVFVAVALGISSYLVVKGDAGVQHASMSLALDVICIVVEAGYRAPNV